MDQNGGVAEAAAGAESESSTSTLKRKKRQLKSFLSRMTPKVSGKGEEEEAKERDLVTHEHLC